MATTIPSPSEAQRSSSSPSKPLFDDLELRILTERLRLLECQRELAAMRCQQFTEMLEASLQGHDAAEADSGEDYPPTSLPRSRTRRRSLDLNPGTNCGFYDAPRRLRRHSSGKGSRRSSIDG